MYEYNPIVRTFNQVRASILAATDTPRCRIRPGATLASVIPRDRCHWFWQELTRRGLRGPGAGTMLVQGCVCFGVLAAAIALVFAYGTWLTALLALMTLGMILGAASLARDAGVPNDWTVGDLTLYCTSFREHKASGYRWARGDIALKVRLIVAENLGVPLDQVQEETSFVEDLGAD